MNPNRLPAAIEKAKQLAETQPDYKTEVFISVLTAELLVGIAEPLPQQQSGSTKPLSIQELLIEKKPTNDVQKTLVFGYYLEKILGKENFTAKDITVCYKSAREPVPPNVSDKIKMNVQNGWMMQMGKTEKMFLYSLTRTGLAKTESGFQQDD